ncbi:hypothetical protein [Hahella sp. NBU794]|uniref:hypothetical protein n=1 Tax=Hahella sp. NBU794 TaxID=3422590 RepID=UPI003D6FD42A
MDEEIKKIVLRMFPELSGNHHLPRLAKIVAISDPLEKPELCDRFRPRYAVDVRVLTPQGEEDPELPLYRCVPLPASYGGIERGQYGFPESGTIVEVAFAYGLPDQPFIRTVLGQGLGAPGVQPGDLVWQQSDLNQAVARDRQAFIQGDDSATVGGSRSATISGSDTQTSANKTINVQGNHTDIASAARQIQAQVIQLTASAAVTIQAPAIAMGGGGVDVLQVIADLIGVVQELAATTASHTHGGGGSGTPSSSGSHSSQASRAETLKGQISRLM